MEICKNPIKDFETTCAIKYKTDLDKFIKEASYEDFYDEEEAVYISTIHKAKGREFDTVYMLLDGSVATTDEEKRKLYVGMASLPLNIESVCHIKQVEKMTSNV